MGDAMERNSEALNIIKEAVRDALTDGTLVSPETHEKHHRYLDAQIKISEKCVENRQRLMVHVLGWMAVSFISVIGYLLWYGYKAVSP